jgi:NitT/TauT family transport system substrate-binding protein
MKQLFVILILLLFVTGCNNTITGEVVKEQNEKISVRLPIPHYDSSFNAFLAAHDQGFYANEGIDVTFNLGNSETNPAKMVATGADEFGVLGGPDALLVAHSRDLPLVAVSVLHRNSDFPGIVTLKESGLTKVDDLEGKKIGFFYGHISTDVIHSLLSKENIDYTEIDVGSNYNQLITGQIDAEWVFRTTGILNLKDKGIELNFISPKDYGINTHGYTIFTTEKMIEENPEIIEKFLRATFKGILFSIREPEKATKSLLKKDPNLKFDLELKRWKEFSQPMSKTTKFPPGYMDDEMFQETYDRLEELGVLRDSFDVQEAYTTQFLDEIYGK